MLLLSGGFRLRGRFCGCPAVRNCKHIELRVGFVCREIRFAAGWVRDFRFSHGSAGGANWCCSFALWRYL